MAKDLFPHLAKQLYSVQGARRSLLCDWLDCQRWVHCRVSLFGWQAAHPTAHGGKSTQVFLQALVSLLVQPSHGPEFGPVEPAKVWVKNNTKGGNHTVEVSLFSPGPSLLALNLSSHLGVQGVVECRGQRAKWSRQYHGRLGLGLGLVDVKDLPALGEAL